MWWSGVVSKQLAGKGPKPERAIGVSRGQSYIIRTSFTLWTCKQLQLPGRIHALLLRDNRLLQHRHFEARESQIYRASESVTGYPQNYRHLISIPVGSYLVSDHKH